MLPLHALDLFLPRLFPEPCKEPVSLHLFRVLLFLPDICIVVDSLWPLDRPDICTVVFGMCVFEVRVEVLLPGRATERAAAGGISGAAGRRESGGGGGEVAVHGFRVLKRGDEG